MSPWHGWNTSAYQVDSLSSRIPEPPPRRHSVRKVKPRAKSDAVSGSTPNVTKRSKRSTSSTRSTVTSVTL